TAAALPPPSITLRYWPARTGFIIPVSRMRETLTQRADERDSRRTSGLSLREGPVTEATGTHGTCMRAAHLGTQERSAVMMGRFGKKGWYSCFGFLAVMVLLLPYAMAR
ncbi:hypothetical protein M9458_042348, partial [Cirrhinus mrigala]